MSSESSSELPARFIERYYPPDQLVTASRWRRLGAYLLDWLVAGAIGGGLVGAGTAVVWAIVVVEAAYYGEAHPAFGLLMLAAGALLILAMVGGYLYWWVSNWLTRANMRQTHWQTSATNERQRTPS